ncbi:transcription elongation factor GreB [Geobacter pelophilus]|uniref:Transcription elongation factor GreB n=1 Tax=Geoanaerobacter pelophilus TaxID=60036 RepID=A0AAW4LCR7_9BACT|nr:transcription elongation factor GreB [Geoanaerobacter pelophilus]
MTESAPSKSNYITPEGVKRLRDELDHLWKVERPITTQRVSDAAAEGDRSENAEYIYGKKRLREIDSRIRFLTKRLDLLKVVDTVPTDQERVYFGAWVTVENGDGEEATYRVVGPDEFDPARNFISIDSPVAKALMGKRINDDVTVHRPAGVTTLTITEVSYRTPPAYE